MANLQDIPGNTTFNSLGSSQLITPSTGGSQTVTSGVSALIINPASTLGTFTVTMPASPEDGQFCYISSAKAVTVLTINANTSQSILNAPTSFILGGFCSFIWNASTSIWFRVS